uniref:Ubiquitin-like protease family profile domain-containing protein n=1 Tax=Parascaris univalens TaxID=6257 RepID=A0A915B064_PARUN
GYDLPPRHLLCLSFYSINNEYLRCLIVYLCSLTHYIIAIRSFL